MSSRARGTGKSEKIKISLSQRDLLAHLGLITQKNPWSIFQYNPCHCEITFTRFSTTDQKIIFFFLLTR